MQTENNTSAAFASKHEKWRAIDGFPDYLVSSYGRVMRVTRAAKSATNSWPGKILTAIKDSHGYARVSLYRNGKIVAKQVHRLVADAFLGPRPRGLTTNHKDGDKMNAHLSNLEYCTQSENMQHAFRLGLCTAKAGEDNPVAKLTSKQVAMIRHLHSTGLFLQRELASQFGIDRSHIGRIVRGVRWRTTTTKTEDF